MILLCFTLAGCLTSETAPRETEPPPSGDLLRAGILRGIAESHFEAPIEATDPIMPLASSSFSWMVCIRSAKSEQSRRITYSVFFKKGAYADARYSVILERCGAREYHPNVS